MRSGLIVISVLAVVLSSCATIPTPQEANDAVLTLRRYESWAWALGIALIWADLVLPIPQTAVIAALGIIYGTLLGGLLGSLGPSPCTSWRVCSTRAVHGRSSSPVAFPTASRRPWSFSPDLRACR